jgi:hypothetical protein
MPVTGSRIADRGAGREVEVVAAGIEGIGVNWIAADRAPVGLQQKWSALLREWDLVLCPPRPTPALPEQFAQPAVPTSSAEARHNEEG